MINGAANIFVMTITKAFTILVFVGLYIHPSCCFRKHSNREIHRKLKQFMN